MERNYLNLEHIIDTLRQKIEEKNKRNGGTYVIGPWDDRVDPETRARWHTHLLHHAYNGGHPASKRPLDEFIEEQRSGRMLTWFLISPEGKPVGMANVEILPNSIAEMCRTCKLKKGKPLIEDGILDKDYNNTVVMYQRLVDFLTNPEVRNSVWCLQADLRLADEITLDEVLIQAGVYTQHINLVAGLKPFLICVPRYQVAPQRRSPYQEIFLESRLYIQPNRINSEPIFTPPTNSPVTIEHIARATYQYAFNFSPEFIHSSQVSSPSSLTLETTAGIHFATITAKGEISAKKLAQITEIALEESRFVELIIPNHPGNIITQKIAYELGFIPLGVKPGGRFLIKEKPQDIPTTIHFGKLQKELKKTIPPIKLADDLIGTPLEELINEAYGLWKS